MDVRERPDGFLTPRRAGVIVFALAACVRLALLTTAAAHDIVNMSDTRFGIRSFEEGLNVAVSLMGGRGFGDPHGLLTGPTAHLPPSFPAVTALIFSAFGTGFVGGVIRNLLNIAGYALLYAMLPAASRALGMGLQAGIAAGLGAAAVPLFRSAEVFRGRDEGWAAVLLLGLLVFAKRLAEGADFPLRSALQWGAGWGLLMYVQPSAIDILPFHAGIVLLARRRRARAGAVKLAVALAALLVTIAPWIVRNRIAMGSWMFMRDDLGLELHIANRDGAYASMQANFGSAESCSVVLNCGVASVRLADFQRLGEVEFYRRDLKEATAWIEEHPIAFGRLTLERSGYFWFDMPSAPVSFVWRTVVSVLGFIGLCLMWRRGLRVPAALLGAVWTAYPLPYYLVVYSNRYVAPIAFALLLPAGFAVVCGWNAARQGRVGKEAAGETGLLAGTRV